MKRFRRSLATASTLGLLSLGTALATTVTTAGADTPACGATITTSITLTADVGPCNTTNGLTVRGTNIQIDLNGHRVFSDAPLPRNNGVDADGIYIPADKVGILIKGSTGVLVKNGTIERFTAGVSIEEGSGNTVQNVTIQDNQGPCIGEDFSTFATGQYGDGIVVFGSPNNRMLGNRIRRNGPFSGIAIVANNDFITHAVPPYPSGSVIQGNTVEDNNLCFANIGIRLEGPGASNSTVTDNVVRNSFQEGIVVHPVNVIDFRPLFQSPPACQNRGFPSPTLPQCPIQNPLNPTNDNNVIRGNTVDHNGYGGQEIPAGPGPAAQNGVSLQTAAGLNLLSFCGYGADANAKGNVVYANTVTNNAGHGINVGGCPLGQNPANGTFPGFTNTQIVNNTSVGNNGRGCGTLPARPACGTRPTTPTFDLHDSTNEMVCPSTSSATQARCATLGFSPPPPSPTPFVGTRVTQPGGKPCDNNTWYGNKYGTAFPLCTTVGGMMIAATSSSSTASSGTASSGVAADTGSGSTTTQIEYPLRRR